jgi:hypothetical protein
LILKRKFLPVFAIILLLTCVAIGTQISMSKAESAYPDVNILSHNGYLEMDDYYYVYGEVQNSGSETVSYTDISADFYDQSGVKIGNYRTDAMLNNLGPSEKSPFKIEVYSKADSARVFRYDISVEGYITTSSLPYKLNFLQGSGQQSAAIYDKFDGDALSAQLYGTFANYGSDTAHFVKIIATYYDLNYNVLYATFDTKDEAVPGSTENRFVIDFLGERTRLVRSYKIDLESNEYSGDSFIGVGSVPEFPSFLTILLMIALASTILFFKKHKTQSTLVQNP